MEIIKWNYNCFFEDGYKNDPMIQYTIETSDPRNGIVNSAYT